MEGRLNVFSSFFPSLLAEAASAHARTLTHGHTDTHTHTHHTHLHTITQEAALLVTFGEINPATDTIAANSYVYGVW